MIVSPPLMQHTLIDHKASIDFIRFSADARWLVTYDASNTLYLWDLSAANPAITARILLRTYPYSLENITFTQDNRWLIAGSQDDKIWLWPLRLEELLDLGCQAAERNLTTTEWTLYFGEGTIYQKTCDQWPEGP